MRDRRTKILSFRFDECQRYSRGAASAEDVCFDVRNSGGTAASKSERCRKRESLICCWESKVSIKSLNEAVNVKI